jgi:hypothetical protein
VEFRDTNEVRVYLDQIRKRLDLIEDFALLVEGETAGRKLAEQLPLPDEPSPGPTFLDLVEDSITTRITGWKYAQQVNGNWRSPYTASAAAEAAGDKNRWREVKSAIQRGGFERLRWFKAPPPQDWRGGDRHAEMIQWVEVISD